MSNRRRTAEDRAEARRRARRAARGPDGEHDLEEEPESASSTPAASGGSFLNRLFPPAPPLPGKGDPMRGFAYAGPLRGVVGGLYLLSRNPLPWILGGLLWAAGQLFRSDSIVGVVALFISFAGLIGAGWLGWQRPWLFGLAAGVVGWLVLIGAFIGLSATFPSITGSASPTPTVQAASPSAAASASLVASPSIAPAESAAATPSPSGEPATATAGSVAVALVTELIFQGGLGGFAGWYGGYLRRRSAVTSAASGASRNRRR
jgi:hypothetical protein